MTDICVPFSEAEASVYRSCSLCSVSEAEVCCLFSEAEVCVLFSEAEACVLFTEAVVCVLFSEAEGRYQDEEQQRGWRGGDAEPRGHGQGAHSPQLHPHQIRGQWPSGRRQQSGQTRRLHSGHLLREGGEQHGTIYILYTVVIKKKSKDILIAKMFPFLVSKEFNLFEFFLC